MPRDAMAGRAAHLSSETEDMTLGSFTEAEAKEVCTWHYEGLYAVYDLSPWATVVENHWELADEDCREARFVSILKVGEMIGFGRIYPGEAGVLIGIGLKPELCAKGLGTRAMTLLAEEAKRRYPGEKVGLEVRSFNKRAIACYEKVGFVTESHYMKETLQGFVAFQYMALS